MEGQLLSLRQAYISDMSILLGLEPFQKLAVVGGGLKAFQSSALVQTLDLGLDAWTKLNKNLYPHRVTGMSSDWEDSIKQFVPCDRIVDKSCPGCGTVMRGQIYRDPFLTSVQCECGCSWTREEGAYKLGQDQQG